MREMRDGAVNCVKVQQLIRTQAKYRSGLELMDRGTPLNNAIIIARC